MQPFGLDVFTWQSAFEVNSCCGMCQHLVLFIAKYSFVGTHEFVFPFIRRPFELFLVWVIMNKVA